MMDTLHRWGLALVVAGVLFAGRGEIAAAIHDAAPDATAGDLARIALLLGFAAFGWYHWSHRDEAERRRERAEDIRRLPRRRALPPPPGGGAPPPDPPADAHANGEP
ncbi:MAG: hypothetical protein HY903_21890 [Deltaproteobacteria bacterium]|nr:hypothetical protein [Deltaproteobacteria bacterium]